MAHSKNRRNGEIITIQRDLEDETLCAICAGLRIIERAIRLKIPKDSPLGVFKHETGAVRFITGHRIAWFFRNIARKVYPDMPESEISKYSAHSIRVMAAVLLDEAGKDSKYLKTRLRWLGDSYQKYLRNTDELAAQHCLTLGPRLKNLLDEVYYTANIIETMQIYE